MKLRTRVLLAIGLTLVCMTAGIYAVTSQVMLSSFTALERDNAERDVERVSRSLRQMIDEMHVKSVDWSTWDDTYVFMSDRNPRYVEANLVDSSIIDLQLDMMMFVDERQQVLFAKPVERVKGTKAPVPEDVLQSLKRDDLLSQVKADGEGHAGLIVQGTTPMLVSIRPILRTSGEGARRGWLVFTRNLDAEKMLRLQEITRLTVELFLARSTRLPRDCEEALTKLDAQTAKHIRPIDEKSLAGYVTMADIYGDPVVLLRMTEPRAIYAQGLATINYVTSLILIAGAVFSIVILFVLERFALSRVSRLSKQVVTIGDADSTRVDLPGKDELSLLAGTINDMLAKQEASAQQLREDDDRLRRYSAELEQYLQEIAANNSVLENAVEGIAKLDVAGCFDFVNAAYARMLGYGPGELAGRSWRTALPVSQHRVMEQALLTGLQNGRATVVLEGAHKDGSTIYIEATTIPAHDRAGVNCGHHLFARDITDRKRLELDIEHQAFHDKLTGLPNRTLLMDRIECALNKARRHRLGTAAIFLDLDNFKLINDSLGHDAGDNVLRAVAERLQASVRPGDTVARLGGDEFTILLEDLSSRGMAEEIAQRILQDLRSPITVGRSELFACASLGIAYAPDATTTSEDLIKNADTAMYAAKSGGKSCYTFYDAGMNTHAQDRMELDTALRKALERGDIRVVYQPLVDLQTGKFTGAEALARWEHPERGPIPPEQFIPLAEDTGLIIPIGYWIMEEACRQMKAWQIEFDSTELCIGVNLSGKQLQRMDVVERVAEVLARTGLPPASLKLEITESILMKDREDVIEKMQRLKDLGIKLALDDFGTGYSSLSTLSSFPLDTLKIDRAFIGRLEVEAESMAIVEAIMALSKSMKMDVVGEGVETSYQLQEIQKLGCQTGQGYLFDKPLSATDFAARLAGGAWTNVGGDRRAA